MFSYNDVAAAFFEASYSLSYRTGPSAGQLCRLEIDFQDKCCWRFANELLRRGIFHESVVLRAVASVLFSNVLNYLAFFRPKIPWTMHLGFVYDDHSACNFDHKPYDITPKNSPNQTFSVDISNQKSRQIKTLKLFYFT